MRLLVTGAAGFIGSEYVRQAVKLGHECIVIDKLTYCGDVARIAQEVDSGAATFYQTDICNREFVEYIFKKHQPEAVMHLAAESHVDRSIMDASPFIDSNVRGTQVLLDTALKTPSIKRFVNMATDEVYGDLGETGFFTEETPLSPSSPYSVSKAAADMLGRAYYRTHGLPVVTVRASNNYGPWQFPEKLLPVVVVKALNNEKIPVYGQGLNIREWLNVSDAAEALLALTLKGKPGEAYNVGSGDERRNIEVVKAILAILGKPESLITYVQDRPGHDFRYSLKTDKIAHEIGWKARINFEKGLEDTVHWYVDNMAWVNEKLDYLRNYWQKVYK